MTIVPGSDGTACKIPANVSKISPGQKATSEACSVVKVSERPTPFPPAVVHFILLRSPGRFSFFFGSLVGFSKINSFALLAFIMGRICSGSRSKNNFDMLKRFVVASSLWVIIIALCKKCVAVSWNISPSVNVEKPIWRAFNIMILTGFPASTCSMIARYSFSWLSFSLKGTIFPSLVLIFKKLSIYFFGSVKTEYPT